MFACEAVDLDFLDTAPNRLSASVKVARPPSEVFAAFAHDPANWGEFFPGFDTTGSYHGSGPHGVGSRCTKRVTGIKVDELHSDERAAALATFDSGLKLDEARSTVYRVDLANASGAVASVLFFDFGTFAGGMLCPEKSCVPDSRFLIMQQENKDQIAAAFRPGDAPREPHATSGRL